MDRFAPRFPSPLRLRPRNVLFRPSFSVPAKHYRGRSALNSIYSRVTRALVREAKNSKTIIPPFVSQPQQQLSNWIGAHVDRRRAVAKPGSFSGQVTTPPSLLLSVLPPGLRQPTGNRGIDRNQLASSDPPFGDVSSLKTRLPIVNNAPRFSAAF